MPQQSYPAGAIVRYTNGQYYQASHENPGYDPVISTWYWSAYHGRGPIQLSWNFNYYAAGNALGVDLLNNPNLVATNSSVSWQTGLWYWMTGTGAAGTTSHNAMVNGNGFGTTIKAINSIECAGAHPDQVQSRVDSYNRFAAILGVPTGGNLYC